MLTYEEALRAYVLQERRVFADSVHVYPGHDGQCDTCDFGRTAAQIDYVVGGVYGSIDIESVSQLLEDLFRLAGA